MQIYLIFFSAGSLLPGHTVCPRGSDPFYIVSYYIKWVTSSWTHSSSNAVSQIFENKVMSPFDLSFDGGGGGTKSKKIF